MNGLSTRLRAVGYSQNVIDAATPSWWTADAHVSEAAQADLKFSIARKLGLDPRSLLQDDTEPTFVWSAMPRFRGLKTRSTTEYKIISSFGQALGRLLAYGSGERPLDTSMSATGLRAAILSSSGFITFEDLLATAWGLGVPVLFLRIFPMTSKKMTAMAIKAGEGYAIVLAKNTNYPAELMFSLAHELGHIVLGHLVGVEVLVDEERDTADGPFGSEIEIERAADEFALELLTGEKAPKIQALFGIVPSPVELAKTCLKVAEELRIEPGILAMCFGYTNQNWPAAFGSLKHIYATPMEAWVVVNRVAVDQFDPTPLAKDSREYLERLMGAQFGLPPNS